MVLAARGPHRLSSTKSLHVAFLASCFVDATPRRASSLCGECSGDCSNADDDPPLVIQDMDLFSSLALQLSHTENHTPHSFQVGCQMPFPRQPRPISADQAEFVIRHSVSSCSCPLHAKRPARTKVPPGQILFCANGRAPLMRLATLRGRSASRRLRRSFLRLPIEE